MGKKWWYGLVMAGLLSLAGSGSANLEGLDSAASLGASADSAEINGGGSGATILWRNKVTGENWLYLMDGPDIVESAPINTVADLNWKVAGVGDFDGDGDMDILWRNSATGENWMYLLDGPDIVASHRVDFVPDLNWKVVGVTDFDGDGKADILWRNFATGQNWMYLMDGHNILESTPVNTVANLDWQVQGVYGNNELPPPPVNLTVNSSGASGVNIGSSTGHGGITNYNILGIAWGTNVSLTAPPSAGGNNFSSWSGCDSTPTTYNCTLSMTSNRTVTANYATSPTTLTVNSSGASGVNISSSTGHGGVTNYTKTGIPLGTSVSLTAPASAGGANFSSWSGCDSTNSSNCTVVMNGNKTVTANYTTPPPTLTVNSSGASGVNISSSTGHGGTTNYTIVGIPSGTNVSLTAPPSAGGNNFSSWSGCDSTPTTYNCTVSMTSNKTVTANYTPPPPPPEYTLTVNSSGASGVSISSSTGHGGTTNYTKLLAPGTNVSLTASDSASGKNFNNWSGCDSTSGANGTKCTVSMTSDRTVMANYTGILNGTFTGSSIEFDVASGKIARIKHTTAGSCGISGWLEVSSPSGLTSITSNSFNYRMDFRPGFPVYIDVSGSFTGNNNANGTWSFHRTDTSCNDSQAWASTRQ